MKVGIVGYSGSGKSTVFQWLTGVKPDPAKSQQGQSGMARIPDARLDWLSAQFRPKKTTPTTLEFVATPRLLATERRAFSAEIWHWPELDDVEPLEIELIPWSPDQAAEEFARRYAELEARR